MKFALGVLTAIGIVAIATAIDPMISAHAWCAVTQSGSCF